MFNFNGYYQGIGSPRPFLFHQRILLGACINLDSECRCRGMCVYPEAAVTKNCNDLAPDISVYTADELPGSDRGKLLVVIELTRHRTLKRDLNKCELLMERFPDIDCFVVDYERNLIYAANTEFEGWITSDTHEMTSRYLLKPIDEYFRDDCY